MTAFLLTNSGLKIAGVALAASGFVSLATGLGTPGSTSVRWYRRYVGFLDRSLQLLFLAPAASKVVAGQVLAGAAVVLVQVVMGMPFWYLVLALIGAAPALYLTRRRKKRTAQITEQVDGFLLAFANGLKTVPSPMAALEAIVSTLPSPIKHEIARTLSEVRVGSTLQQSLLNMSGRVGSRPLDTALSAVLIGLQVGGNLPSVLESTAGTLREMSRLEGVVRTKTAEGKAQLWVLALFPFFVCGAFTWAQPGYFDPLQQSAMGYLAVIASALLWVSALVMARKVLAVDI